MNEWEAGLGGVGPCPKPCSQERRYKVGYRRYEYRTFTHCKCGRCAECGYQLHSAVHMHAHGGKPGDAPFGHQFVPSDTRTAGDGEGA